MNKKWVISILIILILITGSITLYILIKESPKKEELTKPQVQDHNITEEFFNYILNDLGAYKLHNAPLSSSPPKIKFVVDGEIYTSEVKEGNISTVKTDTNEEDIKFTTTTSEIINAVNSPNMKEYFKSSLNDGKITMELKASQTELLSKGYLSIYSELTSQKSTTEN